MASAVRCSDDDSARNVCLAAHVVYKGCIAVADSFFIYQRCVSCICSIFQVGAVIVLYVLGDVAVDALYFLSVFPFTATFLITLFSLSWYSCSWLLLSL